MKSAALRASVLAVLFAGVYAVASQQAGKPAVEKVVQVAEGVWFEQHNDIGKYGSNVAWFELGDGVVVVDTAFPLGAEEAIKNIKETTKGKRIRYAIVTHYHADHSFGTGTFAKEGATIIAHENARKEYLARNLGEWKKRQETDPAAKKYDAYAPDLTFTDKFSLDDGKRRMEIHYYGHAHTTGCIFTWLPKEKVVFSGDACVNGPFNYMGDSDSASWIEVLGRVQALKAEQVVPGHGALGKGDLLETQKAYFVELRRQVGDLVKAGKSREEVEKAVDIPAWKQWTGEQKMNLTNVRHVYQELTRGPMNWLGDPGVTAPAIVAIPKGEMPARLRFLTGPRPADELAGLKQVAPNVEFVVARSREEALMAAPDVRACTGNFVNPEFLREAKNLRWVQQFSAGVEQLVSIPELVANDQVVLTNLKTMYGPNIADHAFALLLSLTRGIPFYEDLRKEQKWGKGGPGPQLHELKGKTMLVVGLGGIGMEVARRAHGFGMRVAALDPREIAVPAFVAQLEKPERLNALLPQADVVTICAPLTPETKGMFGSAQFSLLKPSAYFINIARGKEFDNLALDQALRNGKLAGAGLDVTEPEPLPADHPLWKAPNLIITPHIANGSPECQARIRNLFIENMRRFASGEPLLNVVDKKAGY